MSNSPRPFSVIKIGNPYLLVNLLNPILNPVESNPIDGISSFEEINTSGKKGTSKDYGIPGNFKTIKNPHLERTNWDWEIDSTGLRIGLRRLTSKYGLPILITEMALESLTSFKRVM